ncbi:hypothetical protein F5884DRAFT_777023 [Xylogone sp. PMI_703]|nr:hypothetical protein F5884DRAFT_777023 [Xylogone sp. PMI_703]
MATKKPNRAEEYCLIKDQDRDMEGGADALSSADSTDNDTGSPGPRRSWIISRREFIWQLTTAIFIGVSIFLDTVEYIPVRFSGAAGFYDNGTAYVIKEKDELQYVGDPSPEMDQAWEELIFGRYINITENEAKHAWGDKYDQYYSPGNSNTLRKTIYADYYASLEPVQVHQYHIDHCIDIIRQAIMCYGDLTPIPTRWFEGINQEFIDSNQWHTCRNFSKIREWTTERYNGSAALA